MKKRVKLRKDWKGHSAGTVLEVDADTYKELIDDGTGEAAKEEEEKSWAEVQKSMIEASIKAATDAVEKSLKEMATDPSKMINISVKDKSDDDPTFGYLEGNTKSIKELSKGAVGYAFGLFAKDVTRAANGKESEKLMKCRERSAELVRKAAGDGMIVSGDSEGGYMIFSAASQMIQTAALEGAVIRPKAGSVNMSTQVVRLPYLRDMNHSSGLVYGGIQICFDDELEQYTESKPRLAAIELKLKKMTALGFVSDEWVKWSPVTMGSWLIPKFGEAIGFKEDLVFINGKGGGQPLGLLNAAAKIEVSRESDQDASTFVLENSTKMFARLRVKKDANCVWLMNRTVMPQLPLLNVAVGSGGAPVFINNAGEKMGQSLWGYPIIWTEKIPALGTAGAVTLVDLSDYLIADDQAGPEVAQSMHLKFDYGQTAFRLTKYIDGQNESDTVFQGVYGDTLAPVVHMAAG